MLEAIIFYCHYTKLILKNCMLFIYFFVNTNLGNLDTNTRITNKFTCRMALCTLYHLHRINEHETQVLLIIH